MCACSNGDRLYKFNSNGQLLAKYDKVIQPHQDGRSSIFFTQMAVDGLASIYVLDGSNAHVFVFRADGIFVNRFGGKGKRADQFTFPLSIAVDSQSNVYVGDGRTIKVFDKTGRYLRPIPLPSRITYARALAFNSKGILIALGYDKNVYELNVATAKK